MSKPCKLCVVTSHPIQYMTPWFRALAQDPALELEVIFFRELDATQQGVGFGQAFQWDMPLRRGYSNRVLGVRSGFKSVTKLLWKLFRAILETKPNVVLVTGWNETGLVGAYPLLWLLNIPVIVRGDSNSIKTRSFSKRFLHRILFRLVSGFLVVGKANREFYLNNKVETGRLFPGAHFVESDRMMNMVLAHADGRAVLRNEIGIEEGEFVFTFAGKHESVKRPLLLVEAAALVIQKGSSIKLLFVGSGELTETLKLRADELNVPVHFAGFLNQTEMWKAYVPADAFVLPSLSETWGLVINEAMLFGLPVIVSDQVGCAPDLVIEGETGYVFSGEAEGLAYAMEKLLKNRDNAPAMGATGRKLVLEKYSMSVATDGLKEALKAVSGER